MKYLTLAMLLIAAPAHSLCVQITMEPTTITCPDAGDTTVCEECPACAEVAPPECPDAPVGVYNGEPLPRYWDYNNGAIRDMGNNMVWQIESNPVRMGWNEAVQTCADLDLAGLSWRLPTEAEYVFISDDKFQFKLDPIFKDNRFGVYWTGKDLDDQALGYAIPWLSKLYYPKTDRGYVRCVSDDKL